MLREVLLSGLLLALCLEVSAGQTVRVEDHMAIDVGDDVASASVTQDGRYVLGGGQEGWVKGWELGSKEPMLINHLSGKVQFLSYLSGDSSFVAVAESGEIRKYMWPEGATASTLETRNRPNHVALSAGRRFLAVMTGGDTVELFDLELEQRIGRIGIEKDLNEIVFAGFDRTGRQLAVVSERGNTLSWNPSTQRLLRTMELGGKSLSGSESKVHIAASQRSSNTFIAGVEEVALPKGGVTGRRARPGQLERRDWLVAYDLETGTPEGRFQYPGGAVQALGHGPGNKYTVVVGGKAEEQADIVDLRREKIVRKVAAGSEIASVSVSDRGKWLALGTTGGTILVKKVDVPSEREGVAEDLPALEPDQAPQEPQIAGAEGSGDSRNQSSEQSSDDGETARDETEDEGTAVPTIDRQVPQTAIDRPDDIAVVIGNRDYENSDVPDVDYAVRDAQTIKKYLVRTLGFHEENVIYVENADAAAMKRVFGTTSDAEGQLYDWVKPEGSDVFVYYSGHGAPNPETETAYLVPTNSNPNYLSQNGYPVDQLYENLSQVPAESVTVVMEACFSGVSEEGAVVQDISPAVLSVENPVMAMENGLAFTAGTADQVSTWYNEKKHGLFTYYFLKGLRGAADADGDQAVTAEEMGSYIREKVPYRAQRMHSRKQTPQVIGQAKERVLVQYNGSASSQN